MDNLKAGDGKSKFETAVEPIKIWFNKILTQL